MRNFLPTFFFVFLCLAAQGLFAQQNPGEYEIRTRHLGAGEVVVEMRFVGLGAEPSTSDALLDLSIDLRWPANAGLNILSLSNGGGYGMGLAGTETTDGADEFQSFALDVAPLFLPEAWLRGSWTDIFSVQFNSDGLTGETIAVGALGSNPSNANIPNVNVNGIDFTPDIVGEAVLPIVILAFDAKKGGGGDAVLDWSTASERNASHFGVERSLDTRTWEVVGTVDATGDTDRTVDYQLTDKLPQAGTSGPLTVYYRLNMVDLDGSQTYSETRFLEVAPYRGELLAYPNPTTDFIYVRTEAEVRAVNLYSDSGKLLRESASTTVDLRAFPAGTYRIGVRTSEGERFTTIVKGN